MSASTCTRSVRCSDVSASSDPLVASGISVAEHWWAPTTHPPCWRSLLRTLVRTIASLCCSASSAAWPPEAGLTAGLAANGTNCNPYVRLGVTTRSGRTSISSASSAPSGRIASEACCRGGTQVERPHSACLEGQPEMQPRGGAARLLSSSGRGDATLVRLAQRSPSRRVAWRRWGRKHNRA